MLLLILARDGVLVTENEVHLVCATTLVRSKHDGVWSLVGELLEFDAFRRIRQELNVSATTLQSLLCLDFVPNYHWNRATIIRYCVFVKQTIDCNQKAC
jgi:hypothetical protein